MDERVDLRFRIAFTDSAHSTCRRRDFGPQPFDRKVEMSSLLIFAGLAGCTGLALVMSSRNALVLLMGVEMILVAGVMVILAGAQLHGKEAEGQSFAVFVISVAAAQAAVAFALILNLYRRTGTIYLDRIRSLDESD